MEQNDDRDILKIIRYHNILISYPHSIIFLQSKINIPIHFVSQGQRVDFQTLRSHLDYYNNSNDNSNSNSNNNEIYRLSIKSNLNQLTSTLGEIRDDRDDGYSVHDYLDSLKLIFDLSNISIETIGDDGVGRLVQQDLEGTIIEKIVKTCHEKVSKDAPNLIELIYKKISKPVEKDLFKVFKEKDAQSAMKTPNKRKSTEPLTPSPKVLEKKLKQEQRSAQKKSLYQKLELEQKSKFSFDHIIDLIESPTPVADIDESHPYYMNPVKRLYPYQQASLAKMIKMENETILVNNPLWTKVSDNDNSYKHLLSNKVKKFENGLMPKVALCSGGILCERMGTGKTVICIALILSTLGSQSKFSDSFIYNSNQLMVDFDTFVQHSIEYPKLLNDNNNNNNNN
ncbi:hypothetical protein CYY_006572, partial [Polysphondylium violaceum]